MWIGKKSPPSHRKPAMMKARKVFDGQCVPPSFKPVTGGGGGGGKGGKGASTGSPVHVCFWWGHQVFWKILWKVSYFIDGYFFIF